MTIGQRIAQKRKEKNLSQEALGEQLGVSRQSIYKWESDAALPEIDKLISLSRLFGVTVGWLLGVEEAPAPEQPADADGELSETQLKMVEEIVSRYLAAQPQAAPVRRPRRWLRIGAAAAAVLVCVNLVRLSAQLRQLNGQYQTLQNSVSNVSSTVNGQINSISDRVESILKAQNDLTADYGTDLILANPQTGTAVFSVYAVPKTSMQGMQVQFMAENGSGGVNYVSGEPDSGEKYTATIASPLTDNISLSAVFTLPDGTRQTQLLAQYTGLYRQTLVPVSLRYGDLICSGVHDGSAVLETSYLTVWVDQPELPDGSVNSVQPAAIQSLRVGLFKNKKLVSWLEPCADPPAGFHLEKQERCFRQDALSVPIRQGDELCYAAVYTDQYDRTAIEPDMPCTLTSDGTDLTWASSTYTAASSGSEPLSDWSF